MSHSNASSSCSAPTLVSSSAVSDSPPAAVTTPQLVMPTWSPSHADGTPVTHLYRVCDDTAENDLTLLAMSHIPQPDPEPAPDSNASSSGSGYSQPGGYEWPDGTRLRYTVHPGETLRYTPYTPKAAPPLDEPAGNANADPPLAVASANTQPQSAVSSTTVRIDLLHMWKDGMRKAPPLKAPPTTPPPGINLQFDQRSMYFQPPLKAPPTTPQQGINLQFDQVPFKAPPPGIRRGMGGCHQ